MVFPSHSHVDALCFSKKDLTLISISSVIQAHFEVCVCVACVSSLYSDVVGNGQKPARGWDEDTQTDADEAEGAEQPAVLFAALIPLGLTKGDD